MDDLICIFRVYSEITIPGVEGVVLRRAVEVGSIPDIDACGEGRFEDLEGFLVGSHVVLPGLTCAVVSSYLYSAMSASNARIRPRPFWPIGLQASIGIVNE